MEPSQIHPLLKTLFPEAKVTLPSETTWQVELPQSRLLAIASDDFVQLRFLLPLAPQRDAQPYLATLLEANFDATQLVRYALHQEVLWAVFHHRLDSLTAEDLTLALQQACDLQQNWLRDAFLQSTDKQLRQIIQAAKHQNQSLEATLQNIDRFYQEGILGGLEQTATEREAAMAAWKTRLTQLWSEEA